jgi:hypothetical protein
MNPKKPKSRKSKSAGISLEPDLIKRGKDFAEKNGMKSLSNFVRFLLTQELSKAEGESSYMLSESPGKTIPQDCVSPVVVTPETSAGGHLTRPTTQYQKGGRRKSTT